MAEVEKELSLLDEVRAAAEGIDEAPEVVETGKPPEGETAQEKADRARDEQGRFRAEDKPRETLKLKDPKEKQPAALAPSGPETTGTKPAEEVAAPDGQAAPKAGDEPIAPPAEWKGAGKVQWNKLPKAIQSELRETCEGLAQAREQMAPLEQAIAPHRDTLVRDAGSVESGINQLMQFYNLFLTNPQGLIHHIARTRGIDLGAPQGQPPAQGGTPQTPDINSTIAQAVQQAIAPIQERFQQTETQQISQTIEAFRADPAHPYFNDVSVHMGHLIKAGAAKDMQDAYDQAIWANPAIRTQLLAAQTEEAKTNQAAAADKARKAAAASLRGSPLPNGSSNGATSQGSSVLDDVRAAAAEIAGA